MKVFGPYTRKDGRQHVIIVDNSKRRTVSYPKYLMEQYLGRELDPNLETIHHKDGNVNNNNLTNLKIITRSEHVANDVIRVKITKEFKCPICGIVINIKNVGDYHYNRLRDKAGPFCSKHCAGVYGAKIQNNKMTRLNVDKTDYREYYKAMGE